MALSDCILVHLIVTSHCLHGLWSQHRYFDTHMLFSLFCLVLISWNFLGLFEKKKNLGPFVLWVSILLLGFTYGFGLLFFFFFSTDCMYFTFDCYVHLVTIDWFASIAVWYLLVFLFFNIILTFDLLTGFTFFCYCFCFCFFFFLSLRASLYVGILRNCPLSTIGFFLNMKKFCWPSSFFYLVGI